MLCIFGDSHARRLSQYCHARYFSRGGCRLELPAKPKSSPSYAPIPDMTGGSSYSSGPTTSSQQTQHHKKRHLGWCGICSTWCDSCGGWYTRAPVSASSIYGRGRRFLLHGRRSRDSLNARLTNSRLNRLRVDVVRVAKKIKKSDLVDNVHLKNKGYAKLMKMIL